MNKPILHHCAGYAVHLSNRFGLIAALGPMTQAWYQRLRARNSFAAARERGRAFESTLSLAHKRSVAADLGG
jgi:hypothetical protein